MKGETVLDPFGGLMTVPYCAVKLGRAAIGIELNPLYFRDGVAYVRSVAGSVKAPTLFDLDALDAEQNAAPVAAEPGFEEVVGVEEAA
jgi:hypothetical protein